MNVYLVSIKRKSWCQNYAMVVVAEDKILEKYGIFPFCGEKKGLVVIIAIVLKDVWVWETTWYGKHDKNNNKFSWLRFWEKNTI